MLFPVRIFNFSLISDQQTKYSCTPGQNIVKFRIKTYREDIEIVIVVGVGWVQDKVRGLGTRS